MAQGCLKCLKYTMCVTNFLCFICGISVLGLGIYTTMSHDMSNLLPTLTSLNMPNVLITVGIIITCVSFLGFLGALKENRCLLLTCDYCRDVRTESNTLDGVFVFFLLLFVLMLVQLVAACLLLLYEDSIKDWLEQDLKKGLKDAKAHPGNSTLIESWNFVQEKVECCGVTNATDWGERVPKSCCKDTCTPSHYFKQGCFAKLTQFFEDNFLNTGIAVIVLCIIEVLGMCFAMTLFCHISQSGLGYKL